MLFAGGDRLVTVARRAAPNRVLCAGGAGRLTVAREPNWVLFCDFGVISGLFFGKIATE